VKSHTHKRPLSGEWSCIRHAQCHSALECSYQKVVLTALKHARSTTLVKERSSPKVRISHTVCHVPPCSRRYQTSHPSLITSRVNIFSWRIFYYKLTDRDLWPSLFGGGHLFVPGAETGVLGLFPVPGFPFIKGILNTMWWGTGSLRCSYRNLNSFRYKAFATACTVLTVFSPLLWRALY
jgi:hypothetical protein